MIEGISIGIGFAIGLAFSIVMVLLIVFGIMALYNLSLQRKFTVDLFIKYYNILLKHERFEESDKVSKIIKHLKNKEIPKDLLQDYRVDVNSYLYWQPNQYGGERLVFKQDKKIIRRKRK